MAEYLNFFRTKKKEQLDEDEEAYKQQMKALNEAREILKKQEMEKAK